MNLEALSHQTRMELNVPRIQNQTAAAEDEMIERAPPIQNQQHIQVATNRIVPTQAI